MRLDKHPAGLQRHIPSAVVASPSRNGSGGGMLSEMPKDEPPRRVENEDGVDLTLIRWMLSLSPAERVEHIEGIARSLEELRELNRER